MDKWDLRFMEQAKQISGWSKDPRTRIGSVAVLDRRVLSTGYNGLPRGIEDTREKLYNRSVKHQYVVHAEANCIYNACHHGISLAGSTLYVYGLPVCNECAKGVIQSGIQRVVMQIEHKPQEKWLEAFQITKDMFNECKINYDIYLQDQQYEL